MEISISDTKAPVSRPERSVGSFYTRADGRYSPTLIAASPWSSGLQSGVALAGLCAHINEQVPAPVPMHVARLTIDILRGTPMGPLSATTTLLREGRRLQLLESALHADGQCVVRAHCLRVRAGSSPQRLDAPSVAFPEDADMRLQRQVPWAETITVAGDFHQPGPGARWVRILSPVVSGCTLSPLETVAMLADFGSGVGPLCSPAEWSFANVDISLHLLRLPQDDWMLIESASESAGNGYGVANARLGDRHGMFGSAHQTIFLDSRQRP
jgi:Thioesterase-like superfamily